MNTRVLVTGGAGVIGSRLCEILLSRGHEVLCVDNFFTGTRINISHLLADPRFEAMRHDITSPLFVEVDQIYNLACPASPVHYQRDPVQTVKVSVHGSINMLGLAKRLKSPILQASTSEVYGDPEEHPQSERYWGHVNPVGARACYNEGKRAAETLFVAYRQEHGMETKIARIFNTYGPRMRADDGRVISNFVVQAVRGDPVTVYGDGRQTRSFCYVDDMAEGLIALMNANADVGGPINLGRAEETNMLELAELVVKLTDSRSEILFQPLPPDDPARRCPDTSLAERVLGWSPKVSLEDGLTRTIEYFRGVVN